MLAKMELKPESVAGLSISDLNQREREVLNDWVVRLKAKYRVVGRLTG